MLGAEAVVAFGLTKIVVESGELGGIEDLAGLWRLDAAPGKT